MLKSLGVDGLKVCDQEIWWMFIMVWIDDVERFVGWLCMFMYLMDGLAPNLSWYDSKLLPSVKYDWIIASKSCARYGRGCVFDDEISRRRNLQSYMFERFYEESDLVKNRS